MVTNIDRKKKLSSNHMLRNGNVVWTSEAQSYARKEGGRRL